MPTTRLVSYEPGRYSGRIDRRIEELADSLGKRPMLEDMRESGRYSANPYYREFDTWGDALEAAGFEPYKNNSYTEEDLITELKRLRDQLGRRPTCREMNDLGQYSDEVYKNTFGGWSDALAEAGLSQKHKHHTDVPDEAFLADLQNVASELGHTPAYKEKESHGQYPPGPIYHRFGGWNAALEEAGLEPNRESNLTDSEALDELKKVAAELGHRPRQLDLKTFGRFSHQLYVRRFGSWAAALEKAGFDPKEYVERANVDGIYGDGWSEKKRERVRQRDDYRCQGCGVDQEELEQRLDVHHIIPANDFDSDERRNDMGNLVSLCRPCHRRYEGTYLRPTLVV